MRMFALFLILFSSVCFGEPIKVVVLDTGFKANKNYTVPLCKGYHLDLTKEGAKPSDIAPLDENGHGTHVVGLINQFAQDLPLTSILPFKTNRNNLAKLNKAVPNGYCFVIVKYYSNNGKNAVNWAKGLKYIETIPGKLLINLSGGGGERFKTETTYISKILAKNNKVIAAIGNENNDKGYYPAYEPGVTAVGSIDITTYKKENVVPISEVFLKNKNIYVYKSNYSNYGVSKIVWRFGALYSGGLNDDIVYMRGTSQATAMETGLVLKEMLQNKEK